MKKINKTLPPNALTRFAEANPNVEWKIFTSPGVLVEEGYDGYGATKNLVFNTQGWLCGYCEEKIPSAAALKSKQRIEHFHSKSDKTNPAKNWALDWNNIFGVCVGGNDVDKETHPLPANLSCDSYKDHILSETQKNNCEGLYINPLQLVAFPCLFDFDRANGELKAHVVNCKAISLRPNQHASTEILVTNTIEILNLNCNRLKSNRLEVLKFYNQEIAKARKSKNSQIFQQLAQRWFHHCWPSYFTTRRILLGKHAEDHLNAIGYNG